MINHARLYRAAAADADVLATVEKRLQDVEEERAAALEHLSRAQAAVDLLNQERDRLKTVCGSLRKSLELSRGSYTRQTVSSFPPELLREIFLAIRFRSMSVWFNEGRWEDWSSRRYCCKMWSYLPLRLASVCRHWRAVALGEGRLWAYLDTCELNPGRDSLLRQAARFEAYLKRSGSTPLQVKISHDAILDRDQEVIVDMLAMLADHVHRIQRFDMELHSPLANAGLSMFKIAAPMLVAAHFRALDDADVPVTDFLPSAPLLRVLSFYRAYIPILNDRSDSLNSLNSLNIWSSDDADLNQVHSDVQRWGQSIRKLWLRTVNDRRTAGGQLDLPNLRELCVRDSLFFAPMHGPALVAPQLTKLTLDGISILQTDSTFFAAIASTVTHLEIHLMRLDEIEVLGSLQNVTNLTFGVGESDMYIDTIDDKIFSAFCDRTPPLWSKLVTLRLGPTTRLNVEETTSLFRLASTRGPRSRVGNQNPADDQDNPAPVAVLSSIRIDSIDTPKWILSEVARLMQPAA